ncbi:MAG: hypothetical protein JWR69_1227 [Pedosphaera sp.]|nr:hypothetical protein [Pedosphaera sp.]
MGDGCAVRVDGNVVSCFRRKSQGSTESHPTVVGGFACGRFFRVFGQLLGFFGFLYFLADLAKLAKLEGQTGGFVSNSRAWKGAINRVDDRRKTGRR